jgi:predicted membrane chloride channel (bestrophin family)
MADTVPDITDDLCMNTLILEDINTLHLLELQSEKNPWEQAKRDSTAHHGFRTANAFGARTHHQAGHGYVEHVLSVAIFRCWHIVLFFTLWATAITFLQRYDPIDYNIPDALLKIVGSALGFITATRANGSLALYNEGRTCWSNIILASRTFARTVWFQVSDVLPDSDMSKEEQHARCVVEKRTAINLVEAFAVSMKHYLRGEDGIYYADLYHLVKFLPAYALPGSIVSESELTHTLMTEDDDVTLNGDVDYQGGKDGKGDKLDDEEIDEEMGQGTEHIPTIVAPSSPRPQFVSRYEEVQESREQISKTDELFLLPAFKPKSHQRQIFDVFPFSYIIEAYKKYKGEKSTEYKMKKARAKMMNKVTSKNLPLEITLYLGSYIAALQRRKTNDTPAIGALHACLTQLVDGLTTLERILTTPLPWSYRIHFWVVLTGWNLFLPFQIVDKMRWYTIPSCALASAIYYGFLVAGEEIENPFQYHMNSLHLDHFTQEIIHHELRAVTTSAPPDPFDWVFSPENNLALGPESCGSQRVKPADWILRGPDEMQNAMRSTLQS